MPQGLEMTAKAAKAGVRAARKTLAQALDTGHARIKDVVDASGRRADGGLERAEKAAIDVLDTLTRRGQGYAKGAKQRVYETEARLFPRPRTPPIGTALVGLGAGVLLSLLFIPPRTAPPVQAPRT